MPVRGQRLWVRFFVYTFRDASRSAVLQRSVVEAAAEPR
jgi:hypothetical protein